MANARAKSKVVKAPEKGEPRPSPTQAEPFRLVAIERTEPPSGAAGCTM